MKKPNDDIFLKCLPHLDLHGLDEKCALLYVKDFILENIFLKNEKIVIVHGIGTGILRGSIHNMLKRHKKVKDYYLLSYNLGATVAILEVDN